MVFGCRRDSQEEGVSVATLNRALREQAWLGPLWGGRLPPGRGGGKRGAERASRRGGAGLWVDWADGPLLLPVCRLFLTTPPPPDFLTPIPGPAPAPHPDAPLCALSHFSLLTPTLREVPAHPLPFTTRFPSVMSSAPSTVSW